MSRPAHIEGNNPSVCETELPAETNWQRTQDEAQAQSGSFILYY